MWTMLVKMKMMLTLRMKCQRLETSKKLSYYMSNVLHTSAKSWISCFSNSCSADYLEKQRG